MDEMVFDWNMRVYFKLLASRCRSIRTYYSTLFADTNECKYIPCHSKAMCTDTVGSFTCSCNLGYAGDGFICEGKTISMKFVFIFLRSDRMTALDDERLSIPLLRNF